MSNTGNSVSALIHKLKQSDSSILTTGTTTVSGSSADDTNYIFAGSASNPPTLQFVGGLGTGSHTYSVGSLLAGNGAVDVQAVDTVNVTQGVQVFGGDLSLAETYGSVVALDGNSTIDHGGSLVGYETGAVFASSILINGTVDIGPSGTNTFDIGSGTGVGGAGVVRQTGKADTTMVSSAGKDVRFDVRAGDLVIGGRTVPDSFQATIGPAGGSNASSLGPSAEV